MANKVEKHKNKEENEEQSSIYSENSNDSLLEKRIKRMANNSIENSEKSAYYSEDNLFYKIKGCAKKVGIKVLFWVILLYYSIPKLDYGQRALVFFALGYFIAPIDIVPDFIPVCGYTDDVAALMLIGKTIKDSIDDDSKKKAKEWLQRQNFSSDDIESQLKNNLDPQDDSNI